MKMWTRWVFT